MNLVLKKVDPKEFLLYYQTYYSMVYSDYYFRLEYTTLIEKINYLDAGYLVYKEGEVVGGLFIKPNWLADVFVVPPFQKSKIVKASVNYLYGISQFTEPMTCQEIIEEDLSLFKKEGFKVIQSGYWMLSGKKAKYPPLDSDFYVDDIQEKDLQNLGQVIYESYRCNPSFHNLLCQDDYIKSAKGYWDVYLKDDLIKRCSKIVRLKKNHKIIGVCFNMMFESMVLISELAVLPDHQNRGVGSYLLSHVLKESYLNNKLVRLYCFSDNPAIKLYQDMGFVHNRTLNDMRMGWQHDDT